MALTLTANLTTLTTNDNDGDWDGTDGPDSYNTHIQGTNSESWLVSKNNSETGTWDDGTTYDMSAANTHLYIWFKSDLTNYYTTVKVQITSTTNNYREYEIANQTTKLWGGAWKCFIMDLSGGTETGTFNSASVSSISIIVDNSSSGNIRSVTNNWIDAMRYGTGLTVTGTDFDLTDVEAENSTETNMYGILQNIDGILFCQGKINIGDGATTTTFNSNNEVLVFSNQEVSEDLYNFKLSGSGLTADVGALTLRAAGITDITRFYFDSNDTTSDITFTGSSVTRAGFIDFASGSDITNTVFNDVKQIDPSGAIFQKNTITNCTDASGALLWPDNSNTKTLTFIDNSIGIELKTTGDKSFDAIIYADSSTTGRYDVYNTSGSALTVGLVNDSNPDSYHPSGSVVTFQGSASLSLTVKDVDGAAVQGAYAYIDDDNITPFIMNTSTNVLGVADTTWTGGAVSDATWRVRKYGFKPYKAVSDVPGTGNKDIPVTLIADPQQT